MSAAGAALVSVLVAVGLVLVLPLGLRLLGPDVVPAPRSPAWPLAGAAGTVSLLLPRGPLAVALALPFAVAAAVILLAALRHAVRGGLRAPVVAATVALTMPAVGACALVAERAGWGLLGFGGTYLALTVPHMLYAGFGAALVAGGVAELARRSDGAVDPLAVAGAWGVPVGTVLVLLGYFVGDVAELVGALVLTGALWATAVATTRSLARPAVVTPAARALLVTGVVSVSVSMLLALWWAAGEAFDVAHPGLDVMAATHGVANAFGFVLCTVLGLRLVARRPRDADGPGGHPGAGPGALHGAGFLDDQHGGRRTT
ncbi:YndJ family transporter [Cellulosimicrobium arenosum]|uniref:YndJ family protein n=1 Tax=Cellulosimicrobium arenosum TaxID=2708133 RepID=A0A927PFT5_9MICO|nr:YndJ family protein [Cellulosimicrobium arenosum]